jgi:hypothetical protein
MWARRRHYPAPSEGELAAIRDRILADRDELLKHGVLIWGAGIGEGVVGVNAHPVDRTSKRLLVSRYGPHLDLRDEGIYRPL